MPTSATAHLIRQAYEAGGPYQWGREAWRNSDESGATKIYFGVETQAAESQGVLRRTIIDNGDGMAPEDMRDFLTTFGGGGKPIGVDQNFGQGFKSSVLPWNPYGVVVISYTKAYPNGSMLWIERDSHGDYRLKEWDVEDEDGDVARADVVAPGLDELHGCDWSKVRPKWLTTGTIMVLMGDAANADTVDGDPDPTRKETTQGLVRYLNGRLLEVPTRDGAPVETTIVDIESVKSREGRRESKDSTVTLPSGEKIAWHQRKVEGLLTFIPAEAKTTENSGAVVVDDHGTEVQWFLVPADVKPVAGGNEKVVQSPVIVVDYQGEAYHADASVHRYRQFGITDEIRKRVWLVVKPPVYSDKAPTKWGVLTQASRNMLMAKGGGELPWEPWGDAFFNNFPTALSKARDEVRNQTTVDPDPNMTKNLNRVLDRLNPRFKSARLLSSAMGKIAGFSSGDKAGNPATRPTKEPVKSGGASAGKGGTAGDQEVVTPDAGGDVKAREAQVRGGYPRYEWKQFEPEFEKYLADYDPKAVGVDGDGQPYTGTVYLNTRHPVFVQEMTYWANEVWPKADPKEVNKLVMNVYGQEAVAHVVHAQRLNGSVVGRDENGTVNRLGPEDIRELLDKPALSAAMLGLVNVEQWISTKGGGLFGSRANPAS